MSLDVENEDIQSDEGAVEVIVTNTDPIPVEEQNPLDLTALETSLAALLALFTGAVAPKSDVISELSGWTIPANSMSSVTLIVRQGTVTFATTVHPIGVYTWSAPLLKKLDVMVFDASSSTDAQVLSTQIIA